MKILIIGGSGLVGSHLLAAARAAGHEVVGTYRQCPVPGLLPLDCGDEVGVERLLRAEKADAVIHAAGWTWVDGCEDDAVRAFAENTQQPARIAALCMTLGSRFVYFSTSYVFDGTAGPYVETAATNPINVYGRTKLQAEQEILRIAGNALIARAICVYGAEARGKNFACQVWRALESGQPLTLPSDQRGNPTYAGDVGRWTIELLEKQATGIWHLGGPNPNCTRPEWAEMLVSALRQAGIQAHPQFAIKTFPTIELKQRALRPLHGGLLTPRADALKLKPTTLKESILTMVRDENSAR